MAVPNSARAGWGRAGHRRAVLVGALVALLVLGGGAAAWAEVSGGSTGYRMASVTRADIGTTLTVVGNVEPVSDASPAFGVGGQVTSVTVSPGQQVSAGQTLATLDTTAMSESVSSDQSTLAADEAKLAEDEASQSSAASSSPIPGVSLVPVGLVLAAEGFHRSGVLEHDHHHVARPRQRQRKRQRRSGGRVQPSHHPGSDHADQGRSRALEGPAERGG